MTRLIKYLKNYKLESILGPLFKLLEASFELLVPLVMANIIDIGIKTADKAYIAKMAGIMVILGVVGLICSLTAQYFAAKAAVGFGTELRYELFQHINKLSYSEIDEVGSSTLIARMTSDINQVQSGVNLVLRLFLRSPFIVFGAMIMAFTIDFKAALIFVLAIPLLSLVVFGIMLISMPLYTKVQRQLDKVLLLTKENLTGTRVIRAFNREEEEERQFSAESEMLTKFQLFVGKISALLNPITYIIINGSIIGLVWIGGIEVNEGIITQGAVIALVNYMSQILVELIKLANLIITFTKSLSCANRINQVFEMEPGIEDNKDCAVSKKAPDSLSVEFRNVSFAYKGSKEEALTDISFRAEAGQTVGIIGGTGSGKSTLVNLIPRFYESVKGDVLINGFDVSDYPLEKLRAKIGIVPQKAVLFRGTIKDNLRWGKKDANDCEMYEALKVSQAMEFVEKLDGKLDYSISQGGKNLSGGQKQRLTIARAIVKKPEILILDDSASALDFATDANLRRSIYTMESKMITFIVSQRVSTVRDADLILVLDDGRLAGKGRHSDLLENCEVYKEICTSQA